MHKLQNAVANCDHPNTFFVPKCCVATPPTTCQANEKQEKMFSIPCQEPCEDVHFLPETARSNSKMSPKWSTGLSSTIRIRLRSRSLMWHSPDSLRLSHLMLRCLHWQAAPLWLTQYLYRFASWTTPEIRTMTESTIPIELASDLHIYIENEYYCFRYGWSGSHLPNKYPCRHSPITVFSP